MQKESFANNKNLVFASSIEIFWLQQNDNEFYVLTAARKHYRMMNLKATLDTEPAMEFIPGPLCLETKNEICELIIDGKETAAELARRHNLNASTVRGWVYCLNKGQQQLHSHGGRPRLVDDDLRELCQNYLYDHPNLNDTDLKEYIRTEYDLSQRRKRRRDYNIIADREATPLPHKIARQTLFRFVRQLRHDSHDFVRLSQDY